MPVHHMEAGQKNAGDDGTATIRVSGGTFSMMVWIIISINCAAWPAFPMEERTIGVRKIPIYTVWTTKGAMATIVRRRRVFC